VGSKVEVGKKGGRTGMGSGRWEEKSKWEGKSKKVIWQVKGIEDRKWIWK
jgi:hypothetical protein